MQVPRAPGSLAWCQANILTYFIASRQVADCEARTHCNLYVFCWVAQVLFCQGKSFKQSGWFPLRGPAQWPGWDGSAASGREGYGLNCTREEERWLCRPGVHGSSSLAAGMASSVAQLRGRPLLLSSLAQQHRRAGKHSWGESGAGGCRDTASCPGRHLWRTASLDNNPHSRLGHVLTYPDIRSLESAWV